MTEEEKEAIENLKNYIKVDEIYNGNRKNLSDFDKFCIEHCLDIEIILNLIQKQQEEIKLLKDQQQYVIDEYSETIEKKDKMIYEMAEYINEPYHLPIYKANKAKK